MERKAVYSLLPAWGGGVLAGRCSVRGGGFRIVPRRRVRNSVGSGLRMVREEEEGLSEKGGKEKD